MRDTVHTECTIYLCFAGSGRGTCVPNALGRERGLHPQSPGMVIWMSRTIPHKSSSNLCPKPVIENHFIFLYSGTIRGGECGRLPRIRRLSWPSVFEINIAAASAENSEKGDLLLSINVVAHGKDGQFRPCWRPSRSKESRTMSGGDGWVW